MAGIIIFIVDDQPSMLHALQVFVENEDGMSVAGTAEDGGAAVKTAKSLQPDLVLMDIEMPRLNGIGATRRIVSEIPGTRVPAPTTFSTLDYVAPALRAEAAGYLVKGARLDEILAAIRDTMDDSLPLSLSMVRLMARQVIGGTPNTQAVAGATAAEVRLASHEISVLQFLGNGLSNREIAKKMYVSEGSVKAHLVNACTKLGVRDRLQAVVRGFELGIVSPRLSTDE